MRQSRRIPVVSECELVAVLEWISENATVILNELIVQIHAAFEEVIGTLKASKSVRPIPLGTKTDINERLRKLYVRKTAAFPG